MFSVSRGKFSTYIDGRTNVIFQRFNKKTNAKMINRFSIDSVIVLHAIIHVRQYIVILNTLIIFYDSKRT